MKVCINAVTFTSKKCEVCRVVRSLFTSFCRISSILMSLRCRLYATDEEHN